MTQIKTSTQQQAITDEDGKLSVDIYKQDSNITVIAPIAGIEHKDINIAVNEDVLVISGNRPKPAKIDEEQYLTQECFWGKFSRSIILPKESDTNNIEASFKQNVLIIKIPQTPHKKNHIIKIKEK